MSSVVEVQVNIIYHTQIIHSLNHSYNCNQGILNMTNGCFDKRQRFKVTNDSQKDNIY